MMRRVFPRQAGLWLGALAVAALLALAGGGSPPVSAQEASGDWITDALSETPERVLRGLPAEESGVVATIFGEFRLEPRR